MKIIIIFCICVIELTFLKCLGMEKEIHEENPNYSNKKNGNIPAFLQEDMDVEIEDKGHNTAERTKIKKNNVSNSISCDICDKKKFKAVASNKTEESNITEAYNYKRRQIELSGQKTTPNTEVVLRSTLNKSAEIKTTRIHLLNPEDKEVEVRQFHDGWMQVLDAAKSANLKNNEEHMQAMLEKEINELRIKKPNYIEAYTDLLTAINHERDFIKDNTNTAPYLHIENVINKWGYSWIFDALENGFCYFFKDVMTSNNYKLMDAFSNSKNKDLRNLYSGYKHNTFLGLACEHAILKHIKLLDRHDNYDKENIKTLHTNFNKLKKNRAIKSSTDKQMVNNLIKESLVLGDSDLAMLFYERFSWYPREISEKYWPLFHAAVSSGKENILLKMFEDKSYYQLGFCHQISRKDDSLWNNFLHRIAINDDYETLKLVFEELERKGDERIVIPMAYFRNINDETPLSIVCLKGNKKILDYLLSKGVDINNAMMKGYSLLMWAVNNCEVEMVEFLLNYEQLDLDKVYLGKNVHTLIKEMSYDQRKNELMFKIQITITLHVQRKTKRQESQKVMIRKTETAHNNLSLIQNCDTLIPKTISNIDELRYYDDFEKSGFSNTAGRCSGERMSLDSGYESISDVISESEKDDQYSLESTHQNEKNTSYCLNKERNNDSDDTAILASSDSDNSDDSDDSESSIYMNWNDYSSDDSIASSDYDDKLIKVESDKVYKHLLLSKINLHSLNSDEARDALHRYYAGDLKCFQIELDEKIVFADVPALKILFDEKEVGFSNEILNRIYASIVNSMDGVVEGLSDCGIKNKDFLDFLIKEGGYFVLRGGVLTKSILEAYSSGEGILYTSDFSSDDFDIQVCKKDVSGTVSAFLQEDQRCYPCSDYYTNRTNGYIGLGRKGAKSKIDIFDASRINFSDRSGDVFLFDTIFFIFNDRICYLYSRQEGAISDILGKVARPTQNPFGFHMTMISKPSVLLRFIDFLSRGYKLPNDDKLSFTAIIYALKKLISCCDKEINMLIKDIHSGSFDYGIESGNISTARTLTDAIKKIVPLKFSDKSKILSVLKLFDQWTQYPDELVGNYRNEINLMRKVFVALSSAFGSEYKNREPAECIDTPLNPLQTLIDKFFVLFSRCPSLYDSMAVEIDKKYCDRGKAFCLNDLKQLVESFKENIMNSQFSSKYINFESLSQQNFCSSKQPLKQKDIASDGSFIQRQWNQQNETQIPSFSQLLDISAVDSEDNSTCKAPKVIFDPENEEGDLYKDIIKGIKDAEDMLSKNKL